MQLRYITQRYTTLIRVHYATTTTTTATTLRYICYTNYTAPQLQLQLRYTNYTTLQLQLRYTTVHPAVVVR